MFNLMAALTWDPGVRGVLTVVVAIAVLIGSVYLLLATNSGPRLGFLLAITGLFGWMTIMGLTWSIYGIGKKGVDPKWVVKEINYNDLGSAQQANVRGLPEPSALPDPEAILAKDPVLAKQFPRLSGVKRPSLGDLLGVKPELEDQIKKDAGLPKGWSLLATSDAQTGEAQAAASTYVIDERKLFTAQTDFVVLSSYSFGGKPKGDHPTCSISKPSTYGNCGRRFGFKLKRIVTWPLGNPPHYGVVQLQRVVPQVTPAGQPPPLPVADSKADIISVVMERNLGSRRLPSVAVTIFSGTIFAIGCNTLHRRDKLVTQARMAAAKA